MQRHQTLLMVASCNVSALGAMQLLLDRGANVNAETDDLRMTPLHFACKDGNVRGIKLLLEYGANPYAVDFHGRTPLHYAAMGSPAWVLAKLLKRTKAAQVNAGDEAGYTALMVACEHGRTDVVALLLEHGADPTLRNRLQHLAVELADWFGHRKIMDLLERRQRRLADAAAAAAHMLDGGAVPSTPAGGAMGTPMPLMSPVATPSVAEVRTFGMDGSHAAGGALDPLGAALEKSASTVPFGGGGAGGGGGGPGGSDVSEEGVVTVMATAGVASSGGGGPPTA